MNSTFINYGYYQFYNKILGTSMDQWIPGSLHTCCQLIYDALSSDSIEEVEFGEDRLLTDSGFFTILTLPHLEFLVFLMTLVCPPLVLEIWLLGGTI
jgi:hypothetical protein